MLSRFLDKKNQNQGGDGQVAGGSVSSQTASGQGSLLDLMGPTATPVPAPGQVSSAPPMATGSGSLLTEFGNAEAQHRLHLHQQHAARIAEHEAASAASHPGQHRQAPARTSSGQAEQLDFLAEELDHLKTSLRRENNPSPASEERPVETGYGASSSAFSGLFSFDSFVGTIARSWKFVFLCGLIGAVLTAVYAMSVPNKYQSIAEILIEPRGLKVVNNTVSPNGLNSEATVAYAESQVRIISSSSVIDPVIDDLELMDDPEFVGSSAGNLFFGLAGRVLSDEPRNSGKRSAVKRYLYDNLYVQRVSQTFTIEIAVSTTDPAKSARIANALARSYMADESGARSSVARSASEDLTSRLDDMRQQVRLNEEKVEQYKAANGLVDANGRLVSEVQLSRLNEQLVLAKVQAGDARTRAKLAAETDLGDVISGALPSALTNTTVNQLRLDYSRANARLEKLSTKLGQRHPDRIAATSERRSVLNAISQEMKRVVQTAQKNYKRAKARQDDLTVQVTQLKAAAVNDSAAKVKLRELGRQVEASRQIYESFLLRSRETGAQENIRSSSARIISEAVPIIEKTGPNRKSLVAIGGLAGAGLGMALTLIPLVFVGFSRLRHETGGPLSSAPGVAMAAPGTDTAGDLYTSGAGPAAGAGQLPLPGITRQAANSQHAVSGAASRHAPHRQAAPPMYYENWRR